MAVNSKALTIPSPLIGNLESYIRYTNQLPMLTEVEEHSLAVRLRENDDVEAARQLIMSHLRLVVATARNFVGYGLALGDLIQEGNIGLMKAVRRFDPYRNTRLVSYALYWIRAHIYDFIQKNLRMVKSATTKAKRKLFFNLRQLKSDSGSLKHEEAKMISEKLNVSMGDVVDVDALMSAQDVPLDGYSTDEGEISPAEYLAAESGTPDQMMEAADEERMHTTGLQKALDKLDDRSRRIVNARWLSGEQLTLHQLAQELGVSHERIRQIEEKAFKVMRIYLKREFH